MCILAILALVAAPKLQAQTAPTNFQVGQLPTVVMRLSWDAGSSNAPSFRIDRRVHDETSWVQLAEISSSSVEYLDNLSYTWQEGLEEFEELHPWYSDPAFPTDEYPENPPMLTFLVSYRVCVGSGETCSEVLDFSVTRNRTLVNIEDLELIELTGSTLITIAESPKYDARFRWTYPHASQFKVRGEPGYGDNDQFYDSPAPGGTVEHVWAGLDPDRDHTLRVLAFSAEYWGYMTVEFRTPPALPSTPVFDLTETVDGVSVTWQKAYAQRKVVYRAANQSPVPGPGDPTPPGWEAIHIVDGGLSVGAYTDPAPSIWSGPVPVRYYTVCAENGTALACAPMEGGRPVLVSGAEVLLHDLFLQHLDDPSVVSSALTGLDPTAVQIELPGTADLERLFEGGELVLERNGARGWQTVATSSLSQSSLRDETVEADHAYEYRLCAARGQARVCSDASTVRTPGLERVPMPEATVPSRTETSLGVRWSWGRYHAPARVLVSENGGPFREAGRVPAGTLEYLLERLDARSTYAVRVCMESSGREFCSADVRTGRD